MNLVGVDLEGGGRCWKETLALERGPSTNQSSPPVGGNAWQGSEMPAAPGAPKFYFLFLNHPILSLIHCPPGFCSLVSTLARVPGDTIVKSSRHFSGLFAAFTSLCSFCCGRKQPPGNNLIFQSVPPQCPFTSLAIVKYWRFPRVNLGPLLALYPCPEGPTATASVTPDMLPQPCTHSSIHI